MNFQISKINVGFFFSEPGNKTLKQTAGSLLLGLADNKKPMRDATVAALEMAVAGCNQVLNVLYHFFC